MSKSNAMVFLRELGRRIRAATDMSPSLLNTCSNVYLWLSSVGTVFLCREALVPDFVFKCCCFLFLVFISSCS